MNMGPLRNQEYTNSWGSLSAEVFLQTQKAGGREGMLTDSCCLFLD